MAVRLRRIRKLPRLRVVKPDEWVDVVAVERVGRYAPGDGFKVRAADLDRLPVRAPDGVSYELEGQRRRPRPKRMRGRTDADRSG